jgi:uncharacterized membrane protein (DUF106 family)
MFVFALVLVSALFVLPMSLVCGQSPGVTVDVTNPSHGAAGSNSGIAGSQVTVQGTVNSTGGSYELFFGTQSVLNGTADGYNVNTTFTVPSAAKVGVYNVILQDNSVGVNATQTFTVVPTGISAITTATFLIIGIVIAISFANMALNRALITKMIGWNEYRSMQKEMSEYNAQRMAAIRAQDTKTLEKLKKKESQIQAMQTKMFKPQMLLIPITFIYLIIWPILNGYFPAAVAYLPGFGAIPFFYWYMICSFFFGTVAGRILGTTPIQ